jgi:predicted RNA-binding Zn ribbon-like protein
VSSVPDPQAAPGPLEEVRQLLNTWLVPNDTRVPTDEFDDYARRRKLTRPSAAELRRFRDDIRSVMEHETTLETVLNRWIEETRVAVVVAGGRVRFAYNDNPAGSMVAIVLEAVAGGQWPRLKACPDCRWVFYDHTRNGSKRWCLMNATGSDGRACGNIAKVRRYRARHGASAQPPA